MDRPFSKCGQSKENKIFPNSLKKCGVGEFVLAFFGHCGRNCSVATDSLTCMTDNDKVFGISCCTLVQVLVKFVHISLQLLNSSVIKCFGYACHMNPGTCVSRRGQFDVLGMELARDMWDRG